MKNKYYLFLTLLVTIMIAILYTLHHNITPLKPPFTWWLLPLLFYVISATGHLLITRSIIAQPSQFLNRFLLATAVKFFLYVGILIVWYLLQNKSLTMHFVASFALLYLSVTALDLVSVLKTTRKTG